MQALETTSVSSDPILVSTSEETEESVPIETNLSPSTPLCDILEAMRHSQTGLNFVVKVPNFPPYTFVSYDAIGWLNDHMDGPCNALEILERMKK